MREERAHHRAAVRFWGDDLRAMMMEARPGTPWFEEVESMIERAAPDGLDPALLGADIRSVCEDLGLSAHDLADVLGVPIVVGYALGAGWKRLPTRGLFTVAAAVGVPVSAFVHDGHFKKLSRVLAYEEWTRLENRIDVS
jgi:hypothetical protein